MNNATIILNESINLMNNGIIAGTGEFIKVTDEAGNEKQLEIPEPIHTYKKWQELGFQVRKGEKAIAQFNIWKCAAAKKDKDGNEITPESLDEKQLKMFMKKSSFFKLSQVDAIPAAN